MDNNKQRVKTQLPFNNHFYNSFHSEKIKFSIRMVLEKIHLEDADYLAISIFK